MITQHTILAFSWIVFFILHSLLIDVKIKQTLLNKFPHLTKYYRLLYNFISILTIFPGIYLQMTIYSPKWFDPNMIWRAIALGLIIFGLFIMLVAFKNYKSTEFIGISQLKQNGHSEQESSLATHGLNSIVRHPLYFGIILFMIGFLIYSFSSKTLITTSIFILYIVIGASLEEQKLILVFGDDYKQYQKKVKMLIPYLI